jgi:hypothetical protein
MEYKRNEAITKMEGAIEKFKQEIANLPDELDNLSNKELEELNQKYNFLPFCECIYDDIT